MGIDWEELLGCEDGDMLQYAYDDCIPWDDDAYDDYDNYDDDDAYDDYDNYDEDDAYDDSVK